MTVSMLRIHLFGISVIALVASGAFGASGLPASLENKAKVAFSDIAKAKAALNAGKTTTSQSYLAKSQTLLKNVLDRAPTSTGASSDASAQQGTSAASRAEGELAKVDPSLAAKIGVHDQNPSAGTADAGAGTQPGDAQTQAPPRASGAASLIAEIQSAYEKVSLARTLLKGGDSSKAKSILDQIPSSPAALLKSASGL